MSKLLLKSLCILGILGMIVAVAPSLCQEKASAKISDIETRGEPYTAKVHGDPSKLDRIGPFEVFEIQIIRYVGIDHSAPLKAITRLRKGETIRSGDEVTVWQFNRIDKDGKEEFVLVALKADTNTARDMVQMIRDKQGSIVPSKQN